MPPLETDIAKLLPSTKQNTRHTETRIIVHVTRIPDWTFSMV